MNPHQRCLQAKVKYRNEPKQAMPKSEDLSRSLEINAIWTIDAEFQLFSINHAHILLSSLQLNKDNWVTATLGDRLKVPGAGFIQN